MSSLCGERALIDGYNLRTKEFPKGKDFYAILASTAFKMDYWDCVEFDQNGKYQAEGKARRQAGKVIQLGVSYGMGVKLLIEGINKKKSPGEKLMTMEEGETMMKDFFGKFKALATWKDYNMERLEQFGYMEEAQGRRRRLFDTWLPDYEIKAYKPAESEDIFFNGEGNPSKNLRVRDYEREKEINKKLEKLNFWEKREYIDELKKNSLLDIKSNSGFKSKPKTQATNFTIQSSAAGLTKRALVAIRNHPDRERLGINILVPVHDEILIEGWMSDRQEVLNLLSTCMANSAKGIFEVNMICDGVLETSWNVEHFMDKVQKEFKGNGKKGIPPKTEQEIIDSYPEVDPDCLLRMIHGEFDPETEFFVENQNL